MCTYVDVASFLALSFDKAGRERLSFSELHELRKAVEPDLYDMDAVIDWSRDSYMFATGFYGRFFKGDEEGVSCSMLGEMREDLDYITGSVPEEIRSRLEQSLQGHPVPQRA
jgi:hypothetical protein